MSGIGIVHPVFMAPFLVSQVNAFKAVYKFHKEKGSAKAAKNLKRQSYPPFMVLLVGFFATTAFNKYKKRRETDE